MAQTRPFYRTKAEWAAAEAARCRREAELLPACSTHDWRGVRRRMDTLRTLRAQADKFERMASRYRAQRL